MEKAKRKPQKTLQSEKHTHCLIHIACGLFNAVIGAIAGFTFGFGIVMLLAWLSISDGCDQICQAYAPLSAIHLISGAFFAAIFALLGLTIGLAIPRLQIGAMIATAIVFLFTYYGLIDGVTYDDAVDRAWIYLSWFVFGGIICLPIGLFLEFLLRSFASGLRIFLVKL